MVRAKDANMQKVRPSALSWGQLLLQRILLIQVEAYGGVLITKKEKTARWGPNHVECYVELFLLYNDRSLIKWYLKISVLAQLAEVNICQYIVGW